MFGSAKKLNGIAIHIEQANTAPVETNNTRSDAFTSKTATATRVTRNQWCFLVLRQSRYLFIFDRTKISKDSLLAGASHFP
jgi:hypothetical protein